MPTKIMLYVSCEILKFCVVLEDSCTHVVGGQGVAQERFVLEVSGHAGENSWKSLAL